MIPLSLYIHLPWCIRKCPYCDFNSHAVQNELPEKIYIKKLIADLRQELAREEIWQRPLHSIFIGGGTPSLFSPKAIQHLLTAIRENIPFAHPDIEITLEANPGTVEQEKFRGFRAASVNRLSIGIQSFQADKLKLLGRIHDDQAAQRAVQTARAAGFANFNLDLMHGLPTQKVDDALYDLQTALDFMPPHISWYQLTLEPNTLFHHRPPVLPDEETLQAIQIQGDHLLKANGYIHYEISAYCRPDHASQHNVNYWEFGDYLGIGAGAHGKVTHSETGAVKRYWKIKHPKAYLDNEKFIAEENTVEKKQLPFEFMLNALRLQKPIAFTLFTQRTGLSIDDITTVLIQAEKKQLITITDTHFQTTALGKRFLNDLLTMFMP